MLIQHGGILSVCSNFTSSTKHLCSAVAKSPSLLIPNQLDLTCEFTRLVFIIKLVSVTQICFFSLRHVQNDTETMMSLFNQLKITGNEPPSVLQQYLCIASNLPQPKTVKFLCTELIPHPLSVIGQAAVTVACKLIDGK